MQAIAKMKDTMVDTVGELASGTADAAEEAADRAEEAKNCLKDAAEAKAAELKFLAHKAKHKGAQQATAQLRNAIAAAKAAEGFGSETLAEVDKLGQGGNPTAVGNVKALQAAMGSIVVMVFLLFIMLSDGWTSWQLVDYSRLGNRNCESITSCMRCDMQAACGWCTGMNKCMGGSAVGPKGISGIDETLCKGNGTTDSGIVDALQGNEWVFLVSQCPGMQGRSFGAFASSYTQLEYPDGPTSQPRRVTRKSSLWAEGDGNEAGARPGEGACTHYARKNGFAVFDEAVCASKVMYDKDECHALLALCGDVGGSLRSLLIAAIIMNGAVIPICSSINRKACLPKGRLGSFYRHRLQFRCFFGSAMFITGAILLSMTCVAWLPIYTSLVLMFPVDYCFDEACPHLGTTYWIITFSIVVDVFCAITLLKQSGDLKLPGARARIKLEESGCHTIFEQERAATMAERWSSNKTDANLDPAAKKAADYLAALEKLSHDDAMKMEAKAPHDDGAVPPPPCREVAQQQRAVVAFGQGLAGGRATEGGARGGGEQTQRKQLAPPPPPPQQHQGKTSASAMPAAGTLPAAETLPAASSPRMPRKKRDSAQEPAQVEEQPAQVQAQVEASAGALAQKKVVV
jgi:hypothetical protein